MADVGDELLDGDLDESAFDDLDGEQEDALLADDDFESYENSQVIYRESAHSSDSRRQVYQVIDQVHDGDEILEDGVEDDVLDIAVVDELDEAELDSQGTDQGWTDSSSRTNEDSGKDSSDTVGVSSSTHILVGRGGGESDEEDTEGRGSRFRSERTNVISLKGAIGSKNLKDIPDSLDQVKTSMNNGGGMQYRGRGPRGGMRGRLGPRVGMMGRGGPRHRPPMMHQPQMPPPGHKIHLNPHFRGGMHQGPNVWDNDRLPPPPGCENFPPPQDMGWRGPVPPHYMGRPPHPPHPHHHPHQGPRGPFPGPQGFPPHHPPQQGFEEPFRQMDPHQQSPPNRIVQFNENSQLITVENQHFQRPGYDQNFGPPPNQYQPPPPPQFNNNMYPPQYNPPLRPNFPPNPYPGPNPNPNPNYGGYPPPEYQQNPPYQNEYDNWNSQQPGEFYPPGPQGPSPPFNPPQPQFRHPQPSFPNQPPNFRPPPQKPFQNNPKVSVMKRLAPRLPPINAAPTKQMRFDHNKPAVNTRSNLQEIKTIDTLPDTTTKQDNEPDVEEDEETKQYRMKIAEQKALREKILREKEARRLAAALEKQKNQSHIDNNSNSGPTTVPVQQMVVNPVQVQQKVIVQQPVQRVQPQQRVGAVSQVRGTGQMRGVGRGRGSVNKVLQNSRGKQMKAPVNQAKPNLPQVQIQNIQGTVYKIVKVRTKEGSIVTRKTPIAITQGGVTTSLTKTVTNPSSTGVTVNSNRKVLLNVNNQGKTGTTSILRGTTVPRLVATKNAQGRTLFTVQTTPFATMPKTTPQRLVIDNRTTNPVKVAKPELPDSHLVTIDNLSLSTTQANIQKMAKQVGTVTSFSYEPDKKKATLRFEKVQEAKEFHNKFNRKMVDLSRIMVTVVPE